MPCGCFWYVLAVGSVVLAGCEERRRIPATRYFAPLPRDPLEVMEVLVQPGMRCRFDVATKSGNGRTTLAQGRVSANTYATRPVAWQVFWGSELIAWLRSSDDAWLWWIPGGRDRQTARARVTTATNAP